MSTAAQKKVALVTGAAGFGAGWFTGDRPSPVPRFTRISYTPKVVYRAAFVPEKDAVVYSAATDGNRPLLPVAFVPVVVPDGFVPAVEVGTLVVPAVFEPVPVAVPV